MSPLTDVLVLQATPDPSDEQNADLPVMCSRVSAFCCLTEDARTFAPN